MMEGEGMQKQAKDKGKAVGVRRIAYAKAWRREWFWIAQRLRVRLHKIKQQERKKTKMQAKI